MPMKLNVGVSRKVGLPDYGSVGASCNLELELESGLIERDLDAFHTPDPQCLRRGAPGRPRRAGEAAHAEP